MRSHASVVIAALACGLAGCAVGPDYVRPEVTTPAAYKEATSERTSGATVAAGATWLPAAPADTLPRGDWWRLFGDADLDALASRVAASNQNVAAAAASYTQARAIVVEQRSALFPSLGASVSADRNGGRSVPGIRSYNGSVQASWAPDVWGRVGRAVESAQASADASAADLAAATLSAEGELASNYVSLREADAEIDLLGRTIDAYRRSLTIARNRYAAGVVARTDVLQAETQLATTESDLASRRADRARFEHAIAVLVGQAPADLALAAAEWKQTVPDVPVGVPSTLLQRRPDIAAAERDVAAANAQIGVQRSAYFPSVSLSGSVGSGGSRLGDVFRASTLLWSIGASIAETIFDAGARSARVDQAEAARDVAVARYRQTVLSAFQSVEDRLVDARALTERAERLRAASSAADQAEQQIQNRYRAGQINYTEVVTAQAQALSARRSLVQVQVARQTTAIALIQALGGGWTAIERP